MKKKKVAIMASIILLLVIAVSITVSKYNQQCVFKKALCYIAHSLGKEWKKQDETIVSNLVYSDNEGNTIVFYECTTNYYDAYPQKQHCLNTDAIAAIIDPDKAEIVCNLTLNTFPAVILQTEKRAYLCWTTTPRHSYIIEYDPSVVKESDILKMAKSTLYIRTEVQTD